MHGHLATERAVDAAETEGKTFPVTGRFAILSAADLGCGDMPAKELAIVARAEAARGHAGATPPIVRASRSDGAKARSAACAIAAIHRDRMPCRGQTAH